MRFGPFISPSQQDECEQIAHAQQRAVSTGLLHTVWRDEGALACFVLTGDKPCPYRACSRVFEAHPPIIELRPSCPRVAQVVHAYLAAMGQVTTLRWRAWQNTVGA